MRASTWSARHGFSKSLRVARSGDPYGNSRPDDGKGADRESGLIVPGTIEEVPGQKGADEPSETAAAVAEAENGSEMSACKKVRRNRREQRDAHPESQPGYRIDQQQRQIVRPGERAEAPDTKHADTAAEAEDPLPAPAVREEPSNQVAAGREDPR